MRRKNAYYNKAKAKVKLKNATEIHEIKIAKRIEIVFKIFQCKVDMIRLLCTDDRISF